MHVSRYGEVYSIMHGLCSFKSAGWHEAVSIDIWSFQQHFPSGVPGDAIYPGSFHRAGFPP